MPALWRSIESTGCNDLKILFLAHRVPYPPDKGERIRAYHEIEVLAAEHDIDLFALGDSPPQIDSYAPLSSMCRRVNVALPGKVETVIAGARAFARFDPLSFAFFDCRELRRHVEQALSKENYDAIFVYCSSMMQYVPDPAPCPLILDFVDCDSAKWAQYAGRSPYPMRWLYAREARCLSKREHQFMNRAVCSIVVSGKEARQLSAASNGRDKIKVIGNGANWSNCPAQPEPEIAKLGEYILFMGQMDYRPNVDAVNYFTQEIWPLVLKRHPALKFVIAGRNPSSLVRQLARISGIVVTGTVADIHMYLRGARVVVAPFRISQGVHNKILEAVAEGIPVVCSVQASEGLSESVRQLTAVRDGAISFAAAVCSFLDDDASRARFVRDSESLRAGLRWEQVLKPLRELLHGLQAEREGAGALSASPTAVGR